MKVAPDESFERGGRPLGAWLVELVSDDVETARAAALMLKAIRMALPAPDARFEDIDLDRVPDLEEREREMATAVKRALAEPGFDSPGFVRKLAAQRLALHHEEQRAYREGRRLPPGDERSYMCWAIFHMLDVELLPVIGELLRSDLDHDAVEALVRIGRPGLEHHAVLLGWLDTRPHFKNHPKPEALASIGRGEPVVVDALLARLESAGRTVREGAAATLMHMGPALAGREDRAITLMRGDLEPFDSRWFLLALASVGRHRRDVLDQVLELALPRPARWKSAEAFPEYRYDEVMWERGVAIEALRFFVSFPDPVVPALVAAVDTFEEFDGDWQCDGGVHGRIFESLAPFASAAAPAVPFIFGALEAWQESRSEINPPRNALRLLVAIGSAAADTVPRLLNIRARAMGEAASDPLDKCSELDNTIIQLSRTSLP